MQSEKTTLNIKKILFLIYHHKSIIIVTKKSQQQIFNISITNSDSNLVYETTPRVLFDMLYVNGYIEMKQIISTRKITDKLPTYTIEYYELSKKGENYMKFLYPEG